MMTAKELREKARAVLAEALASDNPKPNIEKATLALDVLRLNVICGPMEEHE